ncbi:pilin [Candidatus Parcubacteria bacterium]|nr:pilin [Candidatus Parcubacteria bacterium]
MNNVKKIFLLIFTLATLSPFTLLHAQTKTGCPAGQYCLLAPLPVGNPTGGNIDHVTVTGAGDYIANLVKLIIAIAGGLAVLRIIIGGFQYITSEAFSSKSAAKDTIQNAVLGFLLAAGSFLILNTINPDLTNINLTLENVGSTQKLDTSFSGGTDSTEPDGTSGGKTAAEVDCLVDCVPIPDEIPHKPPGPAGSPSAGCLTPGPCYVYSGLATKLSALNEALQHNPYNLDWEVTEMFPPVASHDSDCHKPNNGNTGKCVDATLRSPTTPENTVKFFIAINKFVSPSFQWEEPDNASRDARRLALKQYIQSRPPSDFNITASQVPQFITDIICKVKTVAHATGEHVHINWAGQAPSC